MSRTPPDPVEERKAVQFIKRMASGGVDGLDALYTLYHLPLLKLFGAILKDPQEAEEVLQDTFVKAFRSASGYDPDVGSPFAWLVTIGKRTCIDRLRRRRSRPETIPQSREHTEADGDNYPASDDRHPQHQLEYQWMRERLQMLSPAQRQTIELAFFDGYTHHEIAEKLGRPLGTVKSDLNRGLHRLRAMYLEGND